MILQQKPDATCVACGRRIVRALSCKCESRRDREYTLDGSESQTFGNRLARGFRMLAESGFGNPEDTPGSTGNGGYRIGRP